jgi:hypothetical protein
MNSKIKRFLLISACLVPLFEMDLIGGQAEGRRLKAREKICALTELNHQKFGVISHDLVLKTFIFSFGLQSST